MPATGALPRMRLVAPYSNIDIVFPNKADVIIGRDDPAVDVDLTPYEGVKMGLSRQHARIRIQGGQVFIEDMGSTNQTAVNQQILAPGQQQPLHDSDEIRFGRMILTIRIG
jgi:pSer/pThr/pTyr-binding forkhead associated (FHA) protein